MDFWANIFHQINGNDVLEVACGTGRLALPLIKDGIDYSSLVNHDMHCKFGYSLSIEGLINYRFIKKLHLKHVRFEKFINWWEGHASDKGLNKGLKEFYPNIPVMGYLGYVPRTLELQLYPTKYA